MFDRCQPFFQCIKKSTSAVWGTDQEEAFEELKQHLSSPPILFSPSNREILFLYLAISKVVVRAMLFQEEKVKHKLVFYVSRMLLVAETQYSMMDKLVLALVNAMKKLHQYFESHPIVVYTDHPIRHIWTKPYLSG